MGKLEGKIALPLRAAIAASVPCDRESRFVREGAYVFITGRRKAELDAAAEGDQEEMSPAFKETCRTSPISIASLHKSSERRASSILCLRRCRCRPLWQQ